MLSAPPRPEVLWALSLEYTVFPVVGTYLSPLGENQMQEQHLQYFGSLLDKLNNN